MNSPRRENGIFCSWCWELDREIQTPYAGHMIAQHTGVPLTYRYTADGVPCDAHDFTDLIEQILDRVSAGQEIRIAGYGDDYSRQERAALNALILQLEIDRE